MKNPTTEPAKDDPILLQLARKKYPDLKPHEEKLFRAVEEGEPADYSTGDKEKDKPDNAHNWGEDRVLKAEHIAWLCTDKQASKQVTHRGIPIIGARIDGDFDLALATIRFRLGFRRCSFKNKIDLKHAEIRILDLKGTHTKSIRADGLKVGGDVILKNGFKADGEVRFLGAEIGGNLECDGSQFTNRDGYALLAENLKVSGNVFLRSGFRVDGKISFVGANVGGDFNCDESRYEFHQEEEKNSPQKEYIDDEGVICLKRAEIRGCFNWTRIDLTDDVSLDLRSARIGVILSELESWPKEGMLLINGLVYDEIYIEGEKGYQDKIEWLRLQPKKIKYPQPYEQLAKTLLSNGHDREAKKTLIAKEQDRKKRGPKPTPGAWFWYNISGPIIGYGYRPLRPVWIGLIIFALGWLLFSIGNNHGLMSPVKEGDFFADDSSAVHRLPHDYPEFKPLVYSLDMFVPLIDLQQGKYWMPTGQGNCNIIGIPINCNMLQIYLWIHILSGWALTSLFIVGLTGIVRK
ncbi:hypothetical protein CEE37_12905 [candidate division LCP-89 bacterium B3_LCP]|uniref:Membrane-associated oxidoreductase n=1 Tax=candidate division LCP-89 bacterium B3_LCP TaxID=2012998 RepID=A0A532UU77_UNCL8|nr:MAG: hypothetical protein CEE37_12905 [candidate division LCP-89 bacterium B3_LCP]